MWFKKNIDEKQLSDKQLEKIKIRDEKQKLKNEKQEADKKIRKLVRDWISIMAHTKTENQLDETFTLTNIKVEPYGFSCNIQIATSLTFSTIESESMIKIIEDNIGCLFVTKRVPKSKYMKAQFITEDIPEIDFEPMKGIKPYELYLGTSIDGEPIVCSMLKYPHILIQGATNMGKTKMIDCLATNLITQCSPDELSLYFIQADKSDQIIYRKCKHTRAYADTLEKALAITNYLKQVVEHRDKILRPIIEEGLCDNVFDFNKICKKHKQSKFSYIYLIIDEYSSLMPTDSDGKYKKPIKSSIQNNIERLIQVGRYVGVYIIIGLQRSTIDKMPSFVKAMMNTMVTFRVNNEKSSYVAIDSNEAVNLNPRESIIKTNEKTMAKTVTITAPMIVNYIKPFKWSNGEYKDFCYDSFMKLDELFESKKDNKGKGKKKGSNDSKDNTPPSNNNNNTNTNDTKTELKEEDIKKIEKDEKPPVIEMKDEVKTDNKDNNKNIQTKTVSAKNEIKTDIKIPKPKNQFYIENWIDPLENTNVIDESMIGLLKTEKPRKGNK